MGDSSGGVSGVCCACAKSCTATTGVQCLSKSPHYICNACFENHVRELADGAGQNPRCFAMGCDSAPWPFAVIAQHCSEDVFQHFLERGERRREASFRQREAELERGERIRGASFKQREAELTSITSLPYWSDAALPGQGCKFA